MLARLNMQLCGRKSRFRPNERSRELGMSHIRDEINNPTDSFVDELNTIGTVGYRLCGLIE